MRLKSWRGQRDEKEIGGSAHKRCRVEAEEVHREDYRHNGEHLTLYSFDNTSNTPRRKHKTKVTEATICTAVGFATATPEKHSVLRCCISEDRDKDNKTSVDRGILSANDCGQPGLHAKLFHPCEHR